MAWDKNIALRNKILRSFFPAHHLFLFCYLVYVCVNGAERLKEKGGGDYFFLKSAWGGIILDSGGIVRHTSHGGGSDWNQ